MIFMDFILRNIYSGTYKGNKMQQVKSLVGTVSEKIDETLKQSKQASTDKINALLNKMMGMDDFKKLSDEKRQKLKIPFENLLQLVQEQSLIPVVTDMARRFEDDKYPGLLSDMGAWNRQPSRGKDFGDASKPGKQDKEHKISENGTKTIEFVRMNQIQVEYGRAWLENEDDISQYLDSLRRSLHHQVKQGKKIQL